MIGTNHALVGGLIAKFIPWPAAIPLAVASHFLLDALPHYGIPFSKRDHSQFWKIFFTLDFLVALAFAFWAIINQHYAMFAAGLFAVMPDFVWVASVIRHRSFSLLQSNNRFERWHKKIQRYESPSGIWIELPLAVILFYFVILGT